MSRACTGHPASNILRYLRELQREYHTAVLLVHHVRKGAGKERPGQALRGSSDLHGWGDSNLYLRRNSRHLHLVAEHRAAASPDELALQLVDGNRGPTLTVLRAPPPEPDPATPAERILQAMGQTARPVSAQQLRKLCRIRTATLCDTLPELRLRAHAKITSHFGRRCIAAGSVAKTRNIRDIPLFSRLAGHAPQRPNL